MGAFAAPIAYVVASDWTVGETHWLRGLAVAAAAAAPFWLFALWAAKWRQPKLAPYTLVVRDQDGERTLVRECADDEVAAALALRELRLEAGSTVSVSRGPPGDGLAIGMWSTDGAVPDRKFLTPPRWTFYRRPKR